MYKRQTISSISNIEKGVRNVTDKHILLLQTSYNINVNWLRTGKGEMFIQLDKLSLDEHAKQSNLSHLEIAIIHGYMELDCTTRKNIVSKFKSIIQQHDNIMPNLSPVDLELEWYRQELEAEKKGQISLASDEQKSS